MDNLHLHACYLSVYKYFDIIFAAMCILRINYDLVNTISSRHVFICWSRINIKLTKLKTTLIIYTE